jgi:hypothetical protein
MELRDSSLMAATTPAPRGFSAAARRLILAVCCIYHKPKDRKRAGEGSASASDSDSDSDSDGDKPGGVPTRKLAEKLAETERRKPPRGKAAASSESDDSDSDGSIQRRQLQKRRQERLQAEAKLASDTATASGIDTSFEIASMLHTQPRGAAACAAAASRHPAAVAVAATAASLDEVDGID